MTHVVSPELIVSLSFCLVSLFSLVVTGRVSDFLNSAELSQTMGLLFDFFIYHKDLYKNMLIQSDMNLFTRLNQTNNDVLLTKKIRKRLLLTYYIFYHPLNFCLLFLHFLNIIQSLMTLTLSQLS